jgi:hypothetical protein
MVYVYVTRIMPMSGALDRLPANRRAEFEMPLSMMFSQVVGNIGMWIFIGVVAFLVYNRFRMR